MTLDFELLLPLGALAFYLYDCAQSLHGNELLLAHGGGRWRILPRTSLAFAGRELAFIDPLRPHQATYRVAWADADPRGLREDPDRLASFERQLAPLRPLVLALLVLLLVALPSASIGFGAGAVLLLVFATYYLLVLGALAWLFGRRAVLGLGGRAFGSLAFDVLACAPFAVNLLRRVTLARGLAGDPLAFADVAFDPASRESLHRALPATPEDLP